jgi:hypothetical protein
MPTTVITPDAIELMMRLIDVTRDFLAAAKAIHEDLEEMKALTVRSPLLTTKEAAAYIRMSEQYLIQGRNVGTVGKGTPPPNCLEIYGERGEGEKPTIRYEIAECNHWIATAKRRFSGESQERRRKEYAA